VRTESTRSSGASRKKRTPGGTASRASRRKPEIDVPVADNAPRTGAKRTVISTMKELPNFLRLLGGLLTDVRVSTTDKLLVAGAIGYILLPMDIVPDFIPFLGEIDDIFLLVLALQRLIGNTGRAILLEHWMGDPKDLGALNLERVLAAAAFFLPRRVRRRLRTIGRDI
jgi:uncharacterized membrane protein YkvA (DUF1232 family)